ncbi:hypothetical protein C3B44_03260 [Corynebacterium yudongzhengii]|uniref:Uncharacterized protein n=1 Tax=Corynebacterium yudongzhengii TaxID=2080740 RepID=A0A2U1T7G3_9CORY|nr:hypothetical protein [Corynebacterium yudongzhengii]AWB81492.1 hypothetical protein C3B44_03260 [Corynebacterium yudongzhengii]PWC01937.1 hypothetical protein DF222_04985 [Corynebacterium yudongzhengii]
MTTTISPRTADRWLARRAARTLWDASDHHHDPTPATQHARLTVSGLSLRLRPVIERAQVICLRSEPTAALPGTDPLEADFFTRWHRDRTADGQRGVRCQQVINGTAAEIDALRRVVTDIAAEAGFYADVSPVSSSK